MQGSKYMGKITDEMKREFDEHKNGIDSFVMNNSLLFETQSISAYADSLLEKVNNRRKEKGLKKLKKRQIANFGNLGEDLFTAFSAANVQILAEITL